MFLKAKYFILRIALVLPLNFIFSDLVPVKAESSWNGPILIYSLELPKEAQEVPIADQTRMFIGIKNNNQNYLFLVRHETNGSIRMSRLKKSETHMNLEEWPTKWFLEWQNAFIDSNIRVRENIIQGNLAIDLVSRLEEFPLIPELSAYRYWISHFLDSPQVEEIILNDPYMSHTQQVLFAVQEKLQEYERIQIGQVQAPNWTLLFSFLFVTYVDDRGKNIVYEIPNNERAAILSLIDTNNPHNYVTAVLSPFRGYPNEEKGMLTVIENNTVSAEFAKILSEKSERPRISEELQSFLRKTLKVSQISNSIPSNSQASYGLIVYRLPITDRRFPSLAGIRDALEKVWLGENLHLTETGFSPNQLFDTIWRIRFETIPLTFNCREAIKAVVMP